MLCLLGPARPAAGVTGAMAGGCAGMPHAPRGFAGAAQRTTSCRGDVARRTVLTTAACPAICDRGLSLCHWADHSEGRAGSEYSHECAPRSFPGESRVDMAQPCGLLGWQELATPVSFLASVRLGVTTWGLAFLRTPALPCQPAVQPGSAVSLPCTRSRGGLGLPGTQRPRTHTQPCSPRPATVFAWLGMQ